MNFDQAFEKLIGHEGEFSDDPDDPGNWTGGKPGKGRLLGTKYGIAANTYPHIDIPNLTLAEAEQIYRIDYWSKAGCDALPPSLRDDVFDVAVNSGPTQAVKLLQRAVGVTADGFMGPVTLMAISTMPVGRVIARFHGWRLDFMNDLPHWPKYARGWTQRVADYLKAA